MTPSAYLLLVIGYRDWAIGLSIGRSGDRAIGRSGDRAIGMIALSGYWDIGVSSCLRMT
jgi:hypothetical protein